MEDGVLYEVISAVHAGLTLMSLSFPCWPFSWFLASDWFELGELAGKINGIIVMLRVWCTYSMPGSLSINSQQAPLSIVSDTFFEVFGFSF
jgi:hypothetical protein